MSFPRFGLTLPVESHQFRRKGGDIRFVGPAQASWPEAPTRVSRPSPSTPASRSVSSPRPEAHLPSLPNRTAVEKAITPGGSTARRSRWNGGCDLRRGPACACPSGRRPQRGSGLPGLDRSSFGVTVTKDVQAGGRSVAGAGIPFGGTTPSALRATRGASLMRRLCPGCSRGMPLI